MWTSLKMNTVVLSTTSRSHGDSNSIKFSTMPVRMMSSTAVQEILSGLLSTASMELWWSMGKLVQEKPSQWVEACRTTNTVVLFLAPFHKFSKRLAVGLTMTTLWGFLISKYTMNWCLTSFHQYPHQINKAQPFPFRMMPRVRSM